MKQRRNSGSFTKGNKREANRKSRRGGRPTNAQLEAKRIVKEAKRLAGELAKKYLEDYLRPALNNYIASATGEVVNGARRKFSEAQSRHFVERFVPPATKRIILDELHTAEDFYEKVMKGEYEADGEPKRIEDKREKDDPPDPEKLH